MGKLGKKNPASKQAKKGSNTERNLVSFTVIDSACRVGIGRLRNGCRVSEPASQRASAVFEPNQRTMCIQTTHTHTHTHTLRTNKRTNKRTNERRAEGKKEGRKAGTGYSKLVAGGQARCDALCAAAVGLRVFLCCVVVSSVVLCSAGVFCTRFGSVPGRTKTAPASDF